MQGMPRNVAIESMSIEPVCPDRERHQTDYFSHDVAQVVSSINMLLRAIERHSVFSIGAFCMIRRGALAKKLAQPLFWERHLLMDLDRSD